MWGSGGEEKGGLPAWLLGPQAQSAVPGPKEPGDGLGRFGIGRKALLNSQAGTGKTVEAGLRPADIIRRTLGPHPFVIVDGQNRVRNILKVNQVLDAAADFATLSRWPGGRALAGSAQETAEGANAPARVIKS
ncbi:hypothetical protein ABT404_03515 [Streptomyces hyaluromycini]|uniref:Uncharacterized protein n=1 Tax=Streptomyces hyaluromycini TaxID=1377993 RepID=A0ABV1WP42_9ACTN